MSALASTDFFSGLPLAETYVQGLQYLQARVGIVSNDSQLTFIDEYLEPEIQAEQPLVWRNTTSLRKVDKIPYSPSEMDGHIYVVNSSAARPHFIQSGDSLVLIGDFSELEKNPPKRNNTLFGNGGLLTKFFLTLLDKKYGVYSFHATGFYHEEDNELFISIGGPGAGKTVLLFEACLRRGYKVFSSEFLHVKVKGDGLEFYKGAMYDNVRLGNLLYDFPESKKFIDFEQPDTDKVWDTKVTADFSRIQTKEDVLINPKISIIFPKIEGGRKTVTTKFMTDPKKIAVELFLNASEISNRPRAIYGEIGVTSLDTPELADLRLKNMKKMAESKYIHQVASIFGGPDNCLDGIKIRKRIKADF